MMLTILWWLFLESSAAVDRSKFRTCGQTSFCRRHRFPKPSTIYHLEKDSLKFNPCHSKEELKEGRTFWNKMFSKKNNKNGVCDGKYVVGPKPLLKGSLVSSSSEALDVAVHVHSNGVFRVRVLDPDDERYTIDELVLNEDEMESASLENVKYLEKEKELKVFDESFSDDNYRGIRVKTLEGEYRALVIKLSPFEIFNFMEEELVTTLNSEQLFYFEKKRVKTTGSVVEDEETEDRHGGKEITGYWEDGLAIYSDGTREERREVSEETQEDEEGLWEERFSSHTDSKPFGPTSIGIDVKFHKSDVLYGIPEHASSLVLKNTIGENAHYKDPYRLYNLDVFEYELDETMALYGSVPLIVGHGAKGTSGVFWFNPTETFVDIEDGKTHWMSESGIIDVFLFSSKNVASFYNQYATITGRLYLPPMFALGYHQCRWNYKDEKDVFYVHSQFEHYDYPYDVLWLDIEHTDGKRYFTWDDNLFPNPKEMIDRLASEGRHMITIIDPHIKRDDNYYVHKEATRLGYYIKDKDFKKDYEGWCWPGSSSYLDFTNAKVRNWFSSLFNYNIYKGSSKYLHTWNDMNEPSVFNGPEVSMQKDLLNLDGIEHRQWHNVYGMLFQRASLDGLEKRNSYHERGFVLTRSFFAGSQRYGAIWTGDNAAEWSHLKIASSMLLSLNVAALSFVGADVGGFFGNTEPELMIRWMQAGAYTPFFRAHAHHDSKRREPWTFGDDVLKILRRSSIDRYALLPYWYTVFYNSTVTGMPVMRPMWMQYPEEKSLFTIDNQWMIGSALLIKPITSPQTFQTNILFPFQHDWYDTASLQKIQFSSNETVQSINVQAPLEKIPVYQRGGTIITRKLRLRRSSETMKYDPYTLYIALDSNQQAEGELYIDDEYTFKYKTKQQFCFTKFGFLLNKFTNQPSIGSGWNPKQQSQLLYLKVERIIVMGLQQKPNSIYLSHQSLTFDYNDSILVIRKPNVAVDQDWTIHFD